MSVVHGKVPGWRVESFNVDTNGAVTLELALPWEPIVKSSPEALEVPRAPSPPSLVGYGMMGGGWRRTRDGGMAVVYSYGTVDDSFAGKNKQEFGVKWSLAGSFRGRSILTHPNFKNLKKLYGWDDLKRSFTETLPTKRDGSAWEPGTTDAEKISDMYGVTSYDDLSAVLTKTYISRTVPRDLLSAGGKVIKKPWSKINDFEDGRNWMVLPGTAEPHGDVWRIRISFVLSVPGGHNTDVYGQNALGATDRLKASTPRLDAWFGGTE